MNIPLLLRLRQAPGPYVPLADLGADRAQVEADLAELEAFGFAIERHPLYGVACSGPAERLCPDQIEWALETRLVGRRIAVWNRVTSTNDLAARAARSPTNDGLVILAEEQTAGRGQRGRTWSAPPRSSILMSVLLFPPRPLDDPAWLTALGAVAVAEVVEAWTARPARIKWPNDVRVEGRKVAGILVERGPSAVLGIGLNVNLATSEFPDDLRDSATSLRALRCEPVDRSQVARDLIRRLDHYYTQGRDQGAEALNAPWRTRCEHLERGVVVQMAAGGSVAGHLLDIDLKRGLTLATAAGTIRQVPGSEVRTLSGSDQPIPRSDLTFSRHDLGFF